MNSESLFEQNDTGNKQEEQEEEADEEATAVATTTTTTAGKEKDCVDDIDGAVVRITKMIRKFVLYCTEMLLISISNQ